MKHIVILFMLFTACLSFGQENNETEVDPTFWNSEMKNIAKEGSSSGWVLFQDDKGLNPATVFSDNKEAFNLGGHDEMQLYKTSSDNLEMNHYRFQQFYKGLKVEGCEYVVHEQNGVAKSANGKLASGLNLNAMPAIDETTALDHALQHSNATRFGWETLKSEPGEPEEYYSEYPEGELLYTYLQQNENFDKSNLKLAYRFNIITIEPAYTEQAVYIDAVNGDVVKTSSLMANCSNGSALTLFNGTQSIVTQARGFPLYDFYLDDQCRKVHTKIGSTNPSNLSTFEKYDLDNNWIGGYWDRVSASAHWAGSMTYDYFNGAHSRNNWDGSGATMDIVTRSRVAGNDQASWSSNTIHLGSQTSIFHSEPVALDVVGHEFTHGVVQDEAGLVYAGESGALNESFADIFGTMVEYYATSGAGDYFIGEDFTNADGKMRDMSNPGSTTTSPNSACPDTYLGANWSYTGNVHVNSGVQNFWFYILSEGKSGTNDNGDAYNVSGIGRAKAAAIAYRNLTVYLTSTSDYTDAKNGAIQSAIDLFGWCSFELEQTIKAWNAVGVSSVGGIFYNMFIDCGHLNAFRNSGIPYYVKALNSVYSDCNISSATNAQVTFTAANWIELLPGFETEEVFLGFIDPCLANIQLTSHTNTYKEFYKDDHDHSVGVHEHGLVDPSTKVEAFPNPIKNEIFIQGLSNSQATLKLVDVSGKVVMEYSQNTSETHIMDVSSLNKGVYILQVRQNGELHSMKVLKD